jgi:LemA protein
VWSGAAVDRQRKEIHGLMIKLLFITVIVSVIPLFFLFVFASGTSSRLASLREDCQGGLVKLSSELARCHDLVAKVVELLRSCCKGDLSLFDPVAAALRAAAAANQRVAGNLSDAEAMKELARAEDSLNEIRTRLLSAATGGPELKANAELWKLFDQLSAAEDAAATARQAYNKAVTAYNAARRGFPASLISSLGKFHESQPFAAGAPQPAKR